MSHVLSLKIGENSTKGSEVYNRDMTRLDWRIVMLTLLPVIVVTTSLVSYRSMITAFLSYHVFVCLVLPFVYHTFYNRKKIETSAFLGLRWVNMRKSLLLGAGLGIFSFVVIVGFFAAFQELLISKERIQSLLTSWGYKKEFFVLLGIYFIFFNSIVEEIFWRGFLYAHYKKVFGAVLAALVISLCFIQYHFVTIWLFFSLQAAFYLVGVLFLVNLFWCYLREKYGNIYPAILNHLFADLAIMTVYYIFVF